MCSTDGGPCLPAAKSTKPLSALSVRNLVPEELDLVPDLGFSSSVSSLDSLVPGLVPGLFFSSWISS